MATSPNNLDSIRIAAQQAVRDAAEELRNTPQEREIFLNVVGNNPGPGQPIINPINNGFISLKSLRDNQIDTQNLKNIVTKVPRHCSHEIENMRG